MNPLRKRSLSLFIFGALFLVLGLGMARSPKQYASVEGKELIGTRAKEWEAGDWFNSRPRRLYDLKGKVVLVRFWTAPGCPFCAASAPSLNEFYEKYHGQGLEVIGLYHHKSSGPLDPKEVQRHIGRFGFKFPVAIDYEWKTLKKWWLEGRPRAWTSVSFLIDKKGVIRQIHPGGQYVKGDRDYAEIQAKIEELLRESA